jgi:hypothetical protein
MHILMHALIAWNANQSILEQIYEWTKVGNLPQGAELRDDSTRVTEKPIIMGNGLSKSITRHTGRVK